MRYRRTAGQFGASRRAGKVIIQVDPKQSGPGSAAGLVSVHARDMPSALRADAAAPSVRSRAVVCPTLVASALAGLERLAKGTYPVGPGQEQHAHYQQAGDKPGQGYPR